MSALTINDRLLHYEVIGKGKPVLFLHNLVGSWRYWMSAMEGLSGKFRCYAFDLWGYGDSEKKSSLYSMERLVATTNTFLDEMGMTRAALVGHGFGARLAIAYAKKHPDRVDRMVIIDPEDLSLPCSADELRYPQLLDLVKREVGLAPAVVTDSLKADPNAFQNYRVYNSTPSINVPSLTLAAQPVKTNDSPSRRLTLEAQTPSLFPMLAHAAEVERLITEYLLLPTDNIDAPIQVKKYWKRVVR